MPVKKGNIPWNKGKKGVQIAWNKGKPAPWAVYNPNRIQFSKGIVPWNKGKKYPQYSKENCHFWKGGRIVRQGYVLIHKPEHPHNNHCYILEHRLVIEKQIGRYLKRGEEVHHLGERNDNRPNMLMAFSSKSAHKRFHINPNRVKLEEIVFDGRN